MAYWLDVCVSVHVCSWRLTLCDPVDCSLQGSSVHGIFQARVLEWVAISFSRELPNPGIEPRDRTQVSHIVDRGFTIWATRPQVNSREGTQLHPSIENWIINLLNMALPIRTRPSFPLSQSLPSGSFHKPLIFLHHRADRLKTTTTEN